MKETKIKVYSKLNNIEENNEFLAIKNDNVIKYIDLENNKMVIDIKNNLITRENKDYLFNLDFANEKIVITMKKLDKIFEKEMKIIDISISNSMYSVKYLLTDENIINEYYVKF